MLINISITLVGMIEWMKNLDTLNLILDNWPKNAETEQKDKI